MMQCWVAWLVYCRPTILHTATDVEVVSTNCQSSGELPGPLSPVSNIDESPRLDQITSIDQQHWESAGHAPGMFISRVYLMYYLRGLNTVLHWSHAVTSPHFDAIVMHMGLKHVP